MVVAVVVVGEGALCECGSPANYSAISTSLKCGASIHVRPHVCRRIVCTPHFSTLMPPFGRPSKVHAPEKSDILHYYRLDPYYAA